MPPVHERRPKRHIALERAISKLGLASRSEARALVSSGKVMVNGRTAENALAPVDLHRDRIHVAGTAGRRPRWVLLALNKPKSVVTTRHDPQGRATVYDFLIGLEERVVPVGRLDFASTGLLLFTNDTQLANWLTDPGTAIVRRYVVTMRGELADARAAQLESGVLSGGVLLRARVVRVLKRSKRETHAMVELTEGKNREIRRMFEALGHEVTRLKRIAFGGIELGALAPGKWREIPRDAARAAFPGAKLKQTKTYQGPRMRS